MNKAVNDFVKCFEINKKEVKSLSKNEMEDYVNFLYNSENNFNNADTTSGMTCYRECDIETLLMEYLDE